MSGRDGARRGSGIDRGRLLDRLPAVVYEPSGKDKDEFEKADLSQVLLALTHVDQESEYEACKAVALHLLGVVPEPVDMDD